MPFFDALSQSKYEKAQQETWGHLAPKVRTYQGFLVYAHGAYGDLIVVDCEFSDLPDSPWFFEEMWEFVSGQQTERGNVYRFDGTYTKLKTGGYKFRGKTSVVPLKSL